MYMRAGTADVQRNAAAAGKAQKKRIDTLSSDVLY